MNLNLNSRLESYEISDDPDLADWLGEIVDDAFNGGASPLDALPSKAQALIGGLGGQVGRRPVNITAGSHAAGVTNGAGPAKGVSYD